MLPRQPAGEIEKPLHVFRSERVEVALQLDERSPDVSLGTAERGPHGVVIAAERRVARL